jgi:hypothetical protein
MREAALNTFNDSDSDDGDAGARGGNTPSRSGMSGWGSDAGSSMKASGKDGKD